MQRQELSYESLPEYKMFLNSVKSVETKKVYPIYFKKYVEYLGDNDLFCENNPRLIEVKIIDFIVSLKEKGMSFSGVKNYVTAISSFYKINDIMVNTRKISKFMPEQKRIMKDNPYLREQIHSLLDIADDRFRAIILLMASTGIRVGAIPELKLRNLEKVKNYDIYKVTVYENTRDEYFTFTTPECTKAIDRYLEYRKRFGEQLTPNSYLIREQFDVRDPFAISRPLMVKVQTIDRILTSYSERAGIRTLEKLENGKKAGSCRKDIAVCHGFRKFFSSQLVESDLNTELRWLLEGHNLKANDSSYVRTTEQRLLQEYLKAVNNLTINEEHRLKLKVQKLEKEKDKFDLFAMKVADNFRNIEEKLIKIKAEGKEITNDDFNHAMNEFGYQPIGCDQKGKVVLDFDDCDD